MAVVTYIIRVLPLALLINRLQSRYFRSFLYYVPYAVLGVMTFPKVIYSTGDLVSAICGTVVALVLAYFEKGLIIVALGAVIAVYLFGLLIH